MELALLFYLADIVKSLAITLSIIGVVSLILLLMICMYTIDYGAEDGSSIIKCCFRLSAIPVILFLVATLLPSKQGIYQMAAAYGVQTAATNPDVQRLAGKSLEVLENSLDKYLKGDKKDE